MMDTIYQILNKKLGRCVIICELLVHLLFIL